MDPEPAIAFRPLTAEDATLMHRWLNEPHVHEWFENNVAEPTLEWVREEYGPHVEKARLFVIVVDGRDVGYIQTYRILDWPEHATSIDVTDESAGLDLFIGEADFIHRGIGPRALRAFLDQIVFADPAVPRCIVDPDSRNTIAIRAYEKAGFSPMRTIMRPDRPAPELLMQCTR